jgi:hypothetical protein
MAAVCLTFDVDAEAGLGAQLQPYDIVSAR